MAYPTEARTLAVDAVARRAEQPRLSRWLGLAGRHLMLSVLALAFLAPFFWMATSSLKNNQEIFARPIQLLPPAWRWENFPAALSYPGFPFLQFLGNSIYYTGLVVVGTVLSCAAVGYGFARL